MTLYKRYDMGTYFEYRPVTKKTILKEADKIKMKDKNDG